MRRTLLQLFFDQLYTRLAWGYDGVAWLVSGGLWYEWGAAALDYVEQGPVVEVGCGRGRLLPRLAAAGWPTVGLDRSPEMARAARQRHLAVLRGDALALPLADGSVGTLVTVFPAPYVLGRAAQMEFARVVRPGGRWLWVDGPALAPAPGSALARVVTALAYGGTAAPEAARLLGADATGGLWHVRAERVRVRGSTIGVRVAERR